MATKRWTTEEDEYLKKNYPTATPKELEKRLRRSYKAIQSRANRKGYKRQRKKQWTEEKTRFLTENYHKLRVKQISEEINIYTQAIYAKAIELGLGAKENNEYDESEDNKLLQLKAEGFAWKEIAKKLKRSVSSVRARYTKIVGKDKPLTATLDYDKIDEYKRLKLAGEKWNDISSSNDIYKNYKTLGEAIIINAGRDLIESIKSLEKVVDCNIPDELLKECVEEVLKDESAFFTPLYSLCTKIPGEVMVRKCWNQVGVDRNKYLRKNLHLIS